MTITFTNTTASVRIDTPSFARTVSADLEMVWPLDMQVLVSACVEEVIRSLKEKDLNISSAFRLPAPIMNGGVSISEPC